MKLKPGQAHKLHRSKKNFEIKQTHVETRLSSAPAPGELCHTRTYSKKTKNTVNLRKPKIETQRKLEEEPPNYCVKRALRKSCPSS